MCEFRVEWDKALRDKGQIFFYFCDRQSRLLDINPFSSCTSSEVCIQCCQRQDQLQSQIEIRRIAKQSAHDGRPIQKLLQVQRLLVQALFGS